MSENTQKKSSGKISYTLQIIGLLPLLALGIAMLFFTSQWFTKTMYQEVERELYDATKSATTLLNAAYPGDYHLEGAPEPTMRSPWALYRVVRMRVS